MAPNDQSARIRKLVEEYKNKVQEGGQIDFEEFVASHPDLASELRIALQELISDPTQTNDHEFELPDSDVIHVRCPNCHCMLHILPEDSLEDITCHSCGSSFSLIDDERNTKEAKSLKSVGHFELVDKLGTGSFGVVWKAYDQELNRTVALKMPRYDQLDMERELQFQREARTLAQLSHPNIVQVFEFGRDRDQWFIVSELIRGVDLSDWLSNGNRPTFVESAILCAKVARALEHAHQNGVVHRDLKPANIMVDKDGEPHVMDFGLAKRDADEITMTRDGQVLGTLAYMSTEQAKGEGKNADGRTDIYSLGVILFELMTGDRPFRGTPKMIRHQVEYSDPPSPRKLDSSVPKDLETICLKCLEKEPKARFKTASDLADELQRFVDGKPILTRPTSRFYKGIKWIKRNPFPAATLALVLFFLIASPLLAWREYGLRIRATKATEIAAKEKLEAISARRNSEELLDYLITTFRSPDPWLDGKDVKLADVLELALEELPTRLSSSPIDRARLLDALGTTFERLGLYEHAVEAHQQALEMRRQIVPKNQNLVLDSLIKLAKSHENQGSLDDCYRLLGESEQLLDDFPDAKPNLGLRVPAAMAEYHFAIGEFKKTVEILRDLIPKLQSELGEDDDETMSAIANLAMASEQLERHDDAIRIVQEIIKDTSEKYSPDHVRTMEYEQILGDIYRNQEEYDKAIKVFTSLFERRTKILDRDHRDTVRTYNALAVCIFKNGEFVKSHKMFAEIRAIREEKLGPIHLDTLDAMHNLATCEMRIPNVDYEEVIRLLQTVWQQRQEQLGKFEPPTVTTLRLLVTALTRSGAPAEALELSYQQLTALENKLGNESPLALSVLREFRFNLKWARREYKRHFAKGDYQAGKKHLHGLLNVLEKTRLDDETRILRSDLVSLARALRQSGRHEEAAKHFERLLESPANSKKQSEMLLGEMMNSLVAVSEYSKVIQLGTKWSVGQNLRSGDIDACLAEAYYNSGDFESAVQFATSCKESSSLDRIAYRRANFVLARDDLRRGDTEVLDEPFIAAAESIWQKSPASEPASPWILRQTCQVMVQFFEDRGSEQESEKWRQRLQSID